ncbi:MAG TPA: hypothetical protein VHB25_20835 [Gemmatimonadaceae bacterium]|nr:hypothetical protein [Gemmatimonadaceae bacterium]
MTSTAPQPIAHAAHRVTSMPPGTAGGAVSPATGSIRIAGEHFVAATFYLLAGAVGLIWIAPELAAGNFLSPHVAGITHLFTLGWLSTTIFGALYQLLPVALGAPIRWPRVAHASFWTFAPGAGLFACGVADSSTMLHDAGITLLTIGVLLGVGNIAATLPRARHRDVTWAAIALAITFLLSTLALGIVLLHNIHTGFIAGARVRVLATHLHVAIVGWALIMMVGVSHRLLPMFLLAHGAETKWTSRAVVLLAIGVPLLAVGLNTPYRFCAWVAVVALELGVAAFLWQAYSFYRVRVRRNIDVGMRFAATALSFIAVAAIIGPVLLARGASSMRLATAYIVVGLLGGIVTYVVGFFYKIVPLLAWTARYRGQTSKPGVPTVAEMFSARVAKVQLGIMPGAVALLALAIALASPTLAYIGAALFAAAVLLFDSQIIRVALGGTYRRPS